MAHHRPDLLQKLLDAIDDCRNDIFVHIDKKSTLEAECFKVKNAKLFFIKRINVNWAGYSQVECEYRLLEAAISTGVHAYYHFLTGVSYPLWNQDYLHTFFAKRPEVEYIGFDNASDYSGRVRYYYLFAEHGKLKGISGRLVYYLRKVLLFLQKVGRVDRIRTTNLIIKKGCAYWSITDQFARFVLDQEPMVRSLFKYTMYGDEVFIQTLAYNSTFRENIYNLENEYNGAMREVAWPSTVLAGRPGCNFNLNDLEYLLNSSRLFALKFESSDGLELINRISLERMLV
ncbi:MAG: beta-1,6-N-acetylglucosaminyltransferase [Roseburia sp.]|nr:beta-1,6-N-acetylglucosaminyltransferase [Roseburia sp.]